MKSGTIGVHTHITNPVSSGYLAYLACIESWARVADKVVVVDGGSTDSSIPYLIDWLGVLANKVKVINKQETDWGGDQLWCWPQIAINRQVGYASLDTHWAIHVDADHVLCDNISREVLQNELEEFADSDVNVMSFWVSVFQKGVLRRRIRPRAWIVNKRRILEDGIYVAYGIDEKSGSHLDYPIVARKYSGFLDPMTGVKKTFLIGDFVPPGPTLNIDVVRYGHFFFTPNECLNKCRRLDLVLSRYLGKVSSRELALSYDNEIAKTAHTEASKQELLSWPHPSTVKRVISELYDSGMLGGLLRSKPEARSVLGSALLNLTRAERRLRTCWLRARGYRGLKEQLKLLPLDAPSPEAVDVRTVYAEQDKYLPPRCRIQWTR